MLDFTARTVSVAGRVETSQFALRDLLNGIFYYRRAALIAAGIVIAISGITALLMPPTYTAEARLLPLSAGIYDMQDSNHAPQPGQVLDPAAVVNVELQMLDSLELHRAVVRQQLGDAASPTEVNRALDKFESRLHITKVNDANVIEMTYTASDPDVAADTLRQLMARYFESRANVLTAGRVAFLEGQRDKAKEQLGRASTAIAAFQTEHGIVDINAQVAGAVAQDDLLHKNKLEAEAALADGRMSLGTLRSEARGIPSKVELYSDNTEAARALGEMQTSLVALQAKRADLASRFMKGSPQVSQVDRQIESLQAAVRQQRGNLVMTRRTGRNMVFDSTHDRLMQAQASVEGVSARDTALQSQIAKSSARLNQLVTVGDRLRGMMLDRDIVSDSFKSLSTQVEQARVQLNQTSEAGSPSVRVIEAPTPPSKRSNPPLLLIAGGIVAAVLVAGTTVFILASLRDVFLSPAEVEQALGVPVLTAPLLIGGTARGTVHSEYGRMIAAIDAHGRQLGKAVLLLTPSNRHVVQEAALNLGQLLERRHPGNVALIRFSRDAPLPDRGSAIAITPFRDMATGVVGIDACSHHGLDTRLIAELKARYDYVIVTAPPTTESFESIELSRSADLVVPVVQAEVTRGPVLKSLMMQLEEVGSPILGAVLIGRRSYIPQSLYRLLFERTARTV